MYFDSESGLLVRQVRFVDTAVGVIPTQIDYSDYRAVAGVKAVGPYGLLVGRMWSEERTTFDGKHFTVRDAPCNPKPVQRRLPILIGGGGERVLLRLVARHADIWNNLGINHADVARKRDVLAAHCRAIGRDPAEIEISQQTLGAIALDRAAAERKTAEVLDALPFLTGAPDLILAGTPDEIHARVARNRALGISTFVMNLGRQTDPEDVRLFGREVVAAYR